MVVGISPMRYAVLPARAADDRTVGMDMWHQTVTVPSEWQVLARKKTTDFDNVIQALSQHPWGAESLCVQNEFNGFDLYRTSIRGGTPGERSGVNVSKVTQVSSPIIENGIERRGAQYSFMRGSIRLVICRKPQESRQLGLSQVRTLTPRTAAKPDVVLCDVRNGKVQRSPTKSASPHFDEKRSSARRATNHFGETLSGSSPSSDVHQLIKAASADINPRTPVKK
jgi:hypothetical protein